MNNYKRSKEEKMSKNTMSTYYHVENPEPGSFKARSLKNSGKMILEIDDDLLIFFDDKVTILTSLASWVDQDKI